MALNFSHRSMFQSHLSEDMLFSPGRIPNGYLIEGIPEMSANDFGFGRDRADRCGWCGSQESISRDVIDLLPSDPFDMDITTTITGWFENFDVNYGGFGRNAFGNSSGEYNLFADLNLYWNNALQFSAFSTEMQFEDIVPAVSTDDGWTEDKESSNVFFHHGLGLESHVESSSSTNHFHETGENVESNSYGFERDALQYALRFLSLRDLLSVEGVCRSLRSTVQTDTLLWMTIVVDHPLNEKITDDTLFRLTSKAQGKLQSLSLNECPMITDDGLKRVLETNLQLTKLSVPGCARLSVEGIVSTMKKLKSEGTLCIKHLRIGGLCGMTGNHFEDLNLLLGTDTLKQQNNHRPHFYRGGYHYDYPLCDDDLPIDIEACPNCQRLALIYDCPVEGCQGQSGNCSKGCRACRLCIPRCVDCGCCINDSEYEETFCLEWRCSGCYKPCFIRPGMLDDEDKIAPLDADNMLSKKSSCCG